MRKNHTTRSCLRLLVSGGVELQVRGQHSLRSSEQWLAGLQREKLGMWFSSFLGLLPQSGSEYLFTVFLTAVNEIPVKKLGSDASFCLKAEAIQSIIVGKAWCKASWSHNILKKLRMDWK